MAPPGPVNTDLATQLLDQLLSCPALTSASSIQLAYSGGLDSTVLLHLLHTLKQRGQLAAPLGAVHIHHGLQPQADQWLEHCAASAAALALPFQSRKVQVKNTGGSSPEEAAREARYAAFVELLPAGGVLLQAHHQDDQVETVLLHLLRGSGPRGLAGIPASRALGSGTLLRPLLGCTREQLQAYAEQEGLQWVTDHSNEDQGFARNLLRHGVLQTLKQNWPGMQESISRSARLCAEADELNTMLAELDYAAARGLLPNRLDLAVLAQYPATRLRNLLRYWVGSNKEALQGSDIPHQALLHTVHDLIPAPADARPLISWGAPAARLEIRRFQGMLYLLAPMPELPDALVWDTRQELRLPGQLGVLHYEAGSTGSELYPRLEVRFRRGGETMKSRARPNKSVKKLLQEGSIPPWLRDCIPLIYQDDSLLALADIFFSEQWSDHYGDKGAALTWIRSDLHCGY